MNARSRKTTHGIYPVVGIFLVIGYCGLGFSNELVFQHGDTLRFTRGDSVIHEEVMTSIYQEEPGKIQFTQTAKVSPDNRRFLLCEERYFLANDSIHTKLALFSASREKIWEKSRTGDRKIAFNQSRIYDSLVVFVTTNKDNSRPAMDIIKRNEIRNVIKKNEWIKIVDYELSPNYEYMVLHAKNPYNGKLWDYIFFIDLNTLQTWQYLFPICFSCKLGTVKLGVEDTGQVEVIYKSEHRVFSKEGQLIDISIKD